MIGFLRGKVLTVLDDSIILDCNDVGYKIEMGKIDYLIDQEVELFIHTHVREQEIRLFGFKAKEELDLFEKLTSVSGVGPKAGMALISELGYERIVNAINSQSPIGLKVSGVGMKTAEKIILELRTKIAKMSPKGGRMAPVKGNKFEEAIEAMEGLGYKRFELEKTLATITIDEGWESEDIIRELLKVMKKEIKRANS